MQNVVPFEHLTAHGSSHRMIGSRGLGALSSREGTLRHTGTTFADADAPTLPQWVHLWAMATAMLFRLELSRVSRECGLDF